MDITRIILNNGQEISSGTAGTAVVSMKLTRAANSGEELTLGSVCAAMAELELMTEGDSPIHQGDEFILCKGPKQLGVFVAEKPKWSSARRVRITAYDPVAKLDRDMTQWVKELDPWPCTLGELAVAVCQYCGVSLADETFPNADFPVKAFTGQNITGRRIIGWIAQVAGRFCTADENGQLCFDWYRAVSDCTVGPETRNALSTILLDGNLCVTGITAQIDGDNLTLSGPMSVVKLQDQALVVKSLQRQVHYYQGSMQLADYQTAPIEKVQIRQTENDVGVMYPDISSANTYVVSGNPFLTAEETDELLPIAQYLYQQVKDISYTPCTMTVSAEADFKPGDVLQVQDAGGKTVTVYVMESSRAGNRDTLKCTGSANRDSISIKNDQSYSALTGKILQLQTDVAGLRAENADTAGNAAALSLTVEGIETKVTAQSADMAVLKESVTTLRQEKDNIELQIRSIREEGVSRVTTTTGYRFSEEGLQIKKTGMEMENLLNHTGMYVNRNGQVVLRADNQGVEARDVTVGNYLVIGSHARFEDYNNGTACFYI